MAAISTSTGCSSITFNVKFLDEDGKALAELIPILIEHQNKIQKLLPSYFPSNNPKIFKVLQASMFEVVKMQDIIKNKFLDFHHKMGLADKYRVIVSYDSIHNLPQAFCLLVLNRDNVNEKKSIELYSLITAFRNLDISENGNDPQRVKGAGASIIKFSKELGKQQKANYLYLEAAGSAMSFYEKFGFTKVNPDFVDPRLADDKFGMLRTPLFVDLEK